MTDILLLDKFFKIFYAAKLCIKRVIHITEVYCVPVFFYCFHFKCIYSKRIILKAPKYSLGIISKDVDSEEVKKGCELCSIAASTETGDWPLKGCRIPWVRSETLIS